MIDWHARFMQQAGWTRPLRAYLFDQAGLQRAGQVLEVGCGTGAVLAELPASRAGIHGLDLDRRRLAEAGSHAPSARLACGDALNLPYPAKAFDIVFCHYLLLWTASPLRALQEMKRVTRSGGCILALAEPDYTARVDQPQALAGIGQLQTEALRRQGADPGLGGRLAALFTEAGIHILETGTLRNREDAAPVRGERELEWAVLESDLSGIVPAGELARLRDIDARAWETGLRRLAVPTYFAWGRV